MLGYEHFLDVPELLVRGWIITNCDPPYAIFTLKTMLKRNNSLPLGRV